MGSPFTLSSLWAVFSKRTSGTFGESATASAIVTASIAPLALTSFVSYWKVLVSGL